MSTKNRCETKVHTRLQGPEWVDVKQELDEMERELKHKSSTGDRRTIDPRAVRNLTESFNATGTLALPRVLSDKAGRELVQIVLDRVRSDRAGASCERVDTDMQYAVVLEHEPLVRHVTVCVAFNAAKWLHHHGLATHSTNAPGPLQDEAVHALYDELEVLLESCQEDVLALRTQRPTLEYRTVAVITRARLADVCHGLGHIRGRDKVAHQHLRKAMTRVFDLQVAPSDTVPDDPSVVLVHSAPTGVGLLDRLLGNTGEDVPLTEIPAMGFKAGTAEAVPAATNYSQVCDEYNTVVKDLNTSFNALRDLLLPATADMTRNYWVDNEPAVTARILELKAYTAKYLQAVESLMKTWPSADKKGPAFSETKEKLKKHQEIVKKNAKHALASRRAFAVTFNKPHIRKAISDLDEANNVPIATAQNNVKTYKDLVDATKKNLETAKKALGTYQDELKAVTKEKAEKRVAKAKELAGLYKIPPDDMDALFKAVL